jgi:hypothetical protein
MGSHQGNNIVIIITLSLMGTYSSSHREDSSLSEALKLAEDWLADLPLPSCCLPCQLAHFNHTHFIND